MVWDHSFRWGNCHSRSLFPRKSMFAINFFKLQWEGWFPKWHTESWMESCRLRLPGGCPANLVDGLPFFLWCGNPWCEASLHSETSALPLCWFYGAGACWGCKRQTSGLLKFAQLRRIACCMWSGTERTQKQRLWFFMLFCTQSIIILYSVHWGGTRQWHQTYLSLG